MKNRIPTLKVDSFGKTTEEDVCAWIKKMAVLGLLYHFEDSPSEIIDMNNKPLFNLAECVKLEGIVFIIFDNKIDPFKYMIELNEA